MPLPVPPEGWSQFVAETWARRAVHYRGVFDRTFIDSARILRALRRVATDEELAQKGLRVFLDKTLQKKGPEWLPQKADRDLETFGRRIRKTSGSDFTLLLNGATAYDEIIQRRTVAFLRELGKHAPLSFEHDATLYVSDARETTFGRHRDEVNNFIFLVHGKKRFQIWQTPEGAPEAFDLAAGDLLYIPTGHLHIAESARGLCAHLSITAVDNGDDIRELVARVATKLIAETTRDVTSQFSLIDVESTRLPGPIARVVDRYAAFGEELRTAVQEAWAVKSSGFGLLLPPPRRKGRITKADRLAFVPASAFSYQKSGAEYLLIASGHSFRIPAHPRLRRVIEGIRNQPPRTAAHWAKEGSGRARIAGEIVESTPDYVHAMLEELFAIRAIEIVR